MGEPSHIYFQLPAELKLRLVNPEQVLTKCSWLYRLPALVVQADKDIILGVTGDQVLEGRRDRLCGAARAARHDAGGA